MPEGPPPEAEEASASEAERDPGPKPGPPRHPIRRALPALLLLAALSSFFSPALLTREQFLYRDNGRMHWPVKEYLALRLRKGELPQWNPYTSLGAPLLAGAVDAVEHPFNLLFLLLPFPLAFKAWGLLSFALAAFGAFAWARALSGSRPAALAAGLGFALSGPLVGASDNLTYLTTLAAVPWVFAAAQRLVKSPGPLSLLLLALASALCAAGGDPQAWGFAVALLLLYPLVFGTEEPSPWQRLRRGGEAVLASLLGAAPVILPVLAWLSESSRGTALDPAEQLRWNLPLPRLLEFVVPHLYRDRPGALASPLYLAYGGSPSAGIPWVASVYLGASLVALSLVAASRSRRARVLLLWAAAMAFLSLGPETAVGRWLLHLPVLSGFRYWEKMAFWPALFVPVAACEGQDLIAEGGVGLRAAGRAILLLSAASLLFQLFRLRPDLLARLLSRPGAAPALALSFAQNLLDGLLEAGLVALVLGVVASLVQKGTLRLAAAPLLTAVVVADLFAANVRGYELADPLVVEPHSPFGAYLAQGPGEQRVLTPFEAAPDRFPDLRPFESEWLQAKILLEPSFNVAYRVGNFLPYTGMVPARADFYRRRLPEREQLPHVGLFGVGYVVVPNEPLWALSIGAKPPLEVAVADPGLPAFLLRVPHRERAYLAGELATVDRRGAMEFALSADPAKSDRSVIEAPVPPDYSPPKGSARIAVDEPERVLIETESDGPALLVLNDILASGWEAKVDGAKAPILPANYLARGVFVAKGAHAVEFRYRTPLLALGWAVFLLGAIALSAAALLRAQGRSRRP